MKRAMFASEIRKNFKPCHTVHCCHYPEMKCVVYAERMVDAYSHFLFKGFDEEKLHETFAEIIVEVGR